MEFAFPTLQSWFSILTVACAKRCRNSSVESFAKSCPSFVCSCSSRCWWWSTQVSFFFLMTMTTMMTMMMMMRRRKQNGMLKTTCVHIALDYHHIDSWFMIYCDSQRQLTWAVHRSACNAQKHFSRSSIIRSVMICINTIVIIIAFFIFSPSSFITYIPLCSSNCQFPGLQELCKDVIQAGQVLNEISKYKTRNTHLKTCLYGHSDLWHFF